MFITGLQGLIDADGHFAGGRLPGAIPQLTGNCQEVNASHLSSGVGETHGILWPLFRRTRLPRDMVAAPCQ